MAAFDASGIRYLVVGGIAVSFFAEPRYTKDLDLLVAVDGENVATLLHVLREYGAPVSLATPEEFLSEDFVFYFGSPPWRIDLLTSIRGISFEEAYAEHVLLPLGPYQATCISRHHLVEAKRASGRSQDLADLENLLRSEP